MKQILTLIPLLALILTTASCVKEDLVPNKNYSRTKGPGESAHDLLSNDAFTSLKVIIQPVNGMTPDNQTINNLKSFLAKYLNKSSINVELKAEMASPGGWAYSVNDIANIENSHRTENTSGKEIVVYALFVDGSSSEDSSNGKILGQAYYNTSIVMYENTIRSLSGGLGQPTRTKLETTVLEHEIGHLLGLVDTGSKMVTSHVDSAHGKHCTNQNCLMYWIADTSNIISNLINGPIPELDSNCVNDLRANGGK